MWKELHHPKIALATNNCVRNDGRFLNSCYTDYEVISMQNLLSENIKYYREKAHLSQEDLAGKLHISRQAVSSWERGISEPDIQTLQALANLLGIDVLLLIGETTADNCVKIQTSLSHRYLIVLGMLLISLIYYIVKKQYDGLFPLLMVFLMTSTIVLMFGHSIKSNDYSMLAGYDSSIDYHVEIIKKMLLNIQQHILMMSFSVIALLLFLSFTPYFEMGSVVLTLFYIMDFIVAVLFLNQRYQKQMFLHAKDYETSKRVSPVIYIFFLLLFVFVGVSILFFERYNIRNNTTEAVLVFASMLPYMIASIIYLFYENKSVKKEGYHVMNKCLWITITICLLSVIGTWIACSHYL